jgi:crotonobetaine/carnitine-CoA ligase
MAVDVVERIPLEASTIPALFRERLASAPDAAFVRVANTTLSYGDVEAASRDIASALVAGGVVRGDFVAQFMATRPEYLTTYFALSRLGVAMMPINTAFQGYMLEYVLNDAAPRLIFTDVAMLDRLAASEPQFERLETVVVHGADSTEFDALQGRFERLRLLRYEDFLAAAVDGNLEGVGFDSVDHGEPNCVIYTSGTTGPSKGVVLQNSVAVAKALDVVRTCRLTSEDVMYCPAPLFHSLALIRGLVSVLISGASIVFRERFSVSEYWDDTRKFGATVGLSTTTFVNFLKSVEPSPRDTDNPLRCMYVGPVDPEFEQRFGLKSLMVYGMTEASLPIHSRYGEALPPGSCGRLAEDWDVRIADDAGAEVAVGQVGEILMRPRRPGIIMAGYLNKPEATLEAFRDLWFHTGDLGSVDEDGCYFFLGRKKEAIRRRGENISAWEVERMLRDHPQIEDVVALPYPAGDGEEDVWVIAIARQGADLTAHELHAYAREHLPSFMVPRYVELRDAFPKTGIGKIEKYRLRQEGLGPETYDAGEHVRRRRVETGSG